MARIRQTPIPWADKFEDNTYKDMRRGATEDAFWDEKELVDHRRKGGKKPKKTRAGCPANDYKAHVYVWTTETDDTFRSLFQRYFGFYKYEYKICCGCRKRGKGYRLTEQYRKKFKTDNRWSSKEYQHEGFNEYRRKWLIQHGYTKEYYGYWW